MDPEVSRDVHQGCCQVWRQVEFLNAINRSKISKEAIFEECLYYSAHEHQMNDFLGYMRIDDSSSTPFAHLDELRNIFKDGRYRVTGVNDIDHLNEILCHVIIESVSVECSTSGLANQGLESRLRLRALKVFKYIKYYDLVREAPSAALKQVWVG